MLRPVAFLPRPRGATLRRLGRAPRASRVRRLSVVASLALHAAVVGALWETSREPAASATETSLAQALPATWDIPPESAAEPAPDDAAVSPPEAKLLLAEADPAEAPLPRAEPFPADAPPEVVEMPEAAAAPSAPSAAPSVLAPFDPSLRVARAGRAAAPATDPGVIGLGGGGPPTAASASAPPATAGAGRRGGVYVGPAPELGNPTPSFPGDAAERGEGGVVVLRIEIGPDGSVTAIAVERSSGFDALDRAAVETVRAWRFRPAHRDGVPVASAVRQPIRFS